MGKMTSGWAGETRIIYSTASLKTPALLLSFSRGLLFPRIILLTPKSHFSNFPKSSLVEAALHFAPFLIFLDLPISSSNNFRCPCYMLYIMKPEEVEIPGGQCQDTPQRWGKGGVVIIIYTILLFSIPNYPWKHFKSFFLFSPWSLRQKKQENWNYFTPCFMLQSQRIVFNSHHATCCLRVLILYSHCFLCLENLFTFFFSPS